MENEKKKIDIRDKSEKEVLKTYIEIANRTKKAEEIYRQSSSLEEALQKYGEFLKDEEDGKKCK